MLLVDDILAIAGIVIGVIAASYAAKKLILRCTKCGFKGGANVNVDVQAEDVEVEVSV